MVVVVARSTTTTQDIEYRIRIVDPMVGSTTARCLRDDDGADDDEVTLLFSFLIVTAHRSLVCVFCSNRITIVLVYTLRVVPWCLHGLDE